MHFCQTQGVGLQKTLSVCLSPFFLPSNSDFNQRWLERIGEVVWGTEEFSMHFFHNCFHMGVNEATGLLSSPFWGVWSLDVEICQIWGVFSSFFVLVQCTQHKGICEYQKICNCNNFLGEMVHYLTEVQRRQDF